MQSAKYTLESMFCRYSMDTVLFSDSIVLFAASMKLPTPINYSKTQLHTHYDVDRPQEISAPLLMHAARAGSCTRRKCAVLTFPVQQLDGKLPSPRLLLHMALCLEMTVHLDSSIHTLRLDERSRKVMASNKRSFLDCSRIEHGEREDQRASVLARHHGTNRRLMEAFARHHPVLNVLKPAAPSTNPFIFPLALFQKMYLPETTSFTDRSGVHEQSGTALRVKSAFALSCRCLRTQEFGTNPSPSHFPQTLVNRWLVFLNAMRSPSLLKRSLPQVAPTMVSLHRSILRTSCIYTQSIPST
ncbi:hypothetical protein KCU61_g805, partial [Aureobasidium melanogenum]